MRYFQEAKQIKAFLDTLDNLDIEVHQILASIKTDDKSKNERCYDSQASQVAFERKLDSEKVSQDGNKSK